MAETNVKNLRYGTASRTINAKRHEWARLVALSKIDQRSVTRQIMWLTEERIRAMTPAQLEQFNEVLAEYEHSHPYPASE